MESLFASQTNLGLRDVELISKCLGHDMVESHVALNLGHTIYINIDGRSITQSPKAPRVATWTSPSLAAATRNYGNLQHKFSSYAVVVGLVRVSTHNSGNPNSDFFIPY